MPLVHTVVLALHVLFAAAWFGMAAAVPALARGAARPGEATGGKVISAMNVSAVLFYVFALSNWTLGMQDAALRLQYNSWPYHTAVTLGLVLVAAQLFLVRPGWKRLAAAAGTPEAEAGRKRLSAGLGIGHLAWLVTFALMYVGRGLVGG